VHFYFAVNLGHSPSIRRQEPAEEAKDTKDESKFHRKVEFISLKEKVAVVLFICINS